MDPFFLLRVYTRNNIRHVPLIHLAQLKTQPETYILSTWLHWREKNKQTFVDKLSPLTGAKNMKRNMFDGWKSKQRGK